MNITNAGFRRRGYAVLASLALVLLSSHAYAQSCSGAQARFEPANQTVPETTGGAPTVVQLDGTPSQPAGQLTFAWSQLNGPTVTLSSTNIARPTFSAPPVGPAGATLRFRLAVTCGTTTRSSTTDISITDVVSNLPPVAIGSASPATATEGYPVTLDGSSSYDPDGSPLTYQWQQVAGSPTVDLVPTNAAGSIVTFTAPNTSADTVLRFRLTVSDGSLLGTDERVVNISWTNDAPIAQLVCPGGVITVDEGDSVLLDGSASSDPDGTIASYQWSQYSGLPTLGIAGETGSTLAFIAPHLGYNQLGGLVLRLTVQDNDGAEHSADCGVFIRDGSAPLISTPGDHAVEADAHGGATVTYDATAQDAVEDELPRPIACVPPSGNFFPLGPTTVQCDAADSIPNAATASFQVTVVDTTSPVFVLHADIEEEATGPDGNVVDYALPVVNDIADPNPAVACGPPPGSLFPIGATTVVCGAMDASGNEAEPIDFNVSIVDTTDPEISGAADQTLEATSFSGALATFALTASDIADPDVAVVCSHASGDFFPLGATLVECTATDDSGNIGEASFTITVEDTTDPEISGAADQILEATSSAGAVATFALTAADLADPSVEVLCSANSGDVFPLGATLVECTATDDSGNFGEASFTITVRDTTPPVIAAHDDVYATATSGSAAIVDYVKPTASDLVDGPVEVDCTPASGSSFAVSAAGTTVTCSAADGRGNTSESTFKVHVGYAFTGFFRPIDMPEVASNKVKAGSAVPVKFSLGGNQGMGILAAGFPRSVSMLCQGGVTDAVEETVTAGSSSLTYDASTGQYVYVWKTDKGWAGTCRQLQVKLADGSSIKFANFQFTK